MLETGPRAMSEVDHCQYSTRRRSQFSFNQIFWCRRCLKKASESGDGISVGKSNQRKHATIIASDRLTRTENLIKIFHVRADERERATHIQCEREAQKVPMTEAVSAATRREREREEEGNRNEAPRHVSLCWAMKNRINCLNASLIIRFVHQAEARSSRCGFWFQVHHVRNAFFSHLTVATTASEINEGDEA